VNRRAALIGGVGMLALAGGAASCFTIPKIVYGPQPLLEGEHAATIAALAPPKRRRPLVAILADNSGAETTDLIVPLGVLRRSGEADVFIVSTGPGQVRLHPALSIDADHTIAEFDARNPDGPDYVIVPALHDGNAEAAVAWIAAKARGGATTIGICAGALTLAHAGLLEGRRGVTHWYSGRELRRLSPAMIWRADRRYVVDRGVATTTGVSASLPMSLALVEAIAGETRAASMARELSVNVYDARHQSAAFSAAYGFYSTATFNTLNLLGHETLYLPAAPGVDEIALAFTADAWSRTYRSRVKIVGAAETVHSRHGLVLRSDHSPSAARAHPTIALVDGPPGKTLDTVLNEISDRYGASTARFVALQLEYPWSEVSEL
jgi:putative intracellular protease/amidase